ncbi:MAG: tetratricopeptide repeat protein [Terriglobales bacterium]
MRTRVTLTLLVFLLATDLASARDKAENWLEVRSQHFTVVTNANEKTGRRIADQFERMRSVFHVMLPQLSNESGSPIIVLAIKDEKDFRALEPQIYLAKGQLKLGGLFLRVPDKNYVLLRLDAEGDHPYAVVYHEYTHFILSRDAEWLPLWLNEGLAEFYENTDIRDKDVALGQPSPGNIQWLRENRLLPLAALFTVDTSSPYYHEENKGSIFYAESWALTHYLQVKDFQEKTQRLTDYVTLLTKKVDPVTAATRTFGDLTKLQSNLEGYIRSGDCNKYFKLAAATGVDDSTFKVRALAETQADAVRADFLAYNERIADARSLLDHVLQEDPQNVSARETMGFLEFNAGHVEEARKWYEQAAKLDSQSYIAHYYFAAISMNAGAFFNDDAQVESSLRAAIKLNPSFAPAFERLAALEGMHHKDLEEAHMMALTAVQLDPGNVDYRMTIANILMEMDRGADAVTVLRGALKLAKTPGEIEMVQNNLAQAERYETARARMAERNSYSAEVVRTNVEANDTTTAASDIHSEPIEEGVPSGPHHFLVGTLQDVQCHEPGIDLNIAAKGKTMALHSSNYYKIGFTALGFSPKGDLSPCKDLEGMLAKVEYVESSAKPAAAYVVAIELHK